MNGLNEGPEQDGPFSGSKQPSVSDPCLTDHSGLNRSSPPAYGIRDDEELPEDVDEDDQSLRFSQLLEENQRLSARVDELKRRMKSLQGELDAVNNRFREKVAATPVEYADSQRMRRLRDLKVYFSIEVVDLLSKSRYSVRRDRDIKVVESLTEAIDFVLEHS